MNIEFIARRTPEYWVFDHEHENTIDEALCNGTDAVMDEYYKIFTKKDANVGDLMRIVASTEDFEGATTVLEFAKSDCGGSVYLDMVLFEEVWLCPWLQSYFGEVPKYLFVKVDPVNVALENFQKNYAHPFKKFQQVEEDLLSEYSDEEVVDFVDSISK